MTDRAKKATELQACSSPVSADLVVVASNTSGNAVSKKVTVGNLLANSTATVSSNTFVFRNKSTPANSTITVSQGTIWFDDSYVYVAVSNNTVKRASLSSF